MFNYSVNGMSLTDCQAVCLERYDCNTNNGCASTGFALTGNTLTECQQICTIQSYTCEYYSACQPRYDTSGEFANEAACAASCKERAYCDPSSGCQSNGFGTSGLLFADCATECTIQSYTCEYYSGCQTRYDTSGEFPTQEACQTDCLARYTCQIVVFYNYVYCDFIGYGPTGQTQTECEAECVIGSYNCGNPCQPVIGPGGAYATQADCNATCSANYDCIDYGGGYVQCTYTGYQENGTAYETCIANCPQPMTMREAPDMQEWLTAAKDVQAAPNNTAEYPRYFVSARPVFPPKPLQEEDPDGPGTVLSGMLEKVGIKSSPTCSCKARARIMNVNGNDWCAENLELLIGWLREEAQKRKLPFIDIAGRLIIKRAISLSRAAKRKNAQK
jgi:hypothetical protein